MAAPPPGPTAEYELPTPPQDPISALAFNPNPAPERVGLLLVASWDKKVRLYDTAQASSTDEVRLLHTFEHDAAVLDVCWISDTLAASGGLDRRVRLLNLETGQSQIIGKHSNAVSRVRYCPETRLLLSGSWDRSVKLWDMLAESPTLLRTLPMPDKVLAMDLSPPFPSAPPAGADTTPRAVIAMTGRVVHIFALRKLREAVDARKDAQGQDATGPEWEPEQRRESSLKFMLRDVRCMPAGDGYATSSVEGRIAVEFFDPSAEAQARKYAFKCHRQVIDGVDTVYPVNAIAFHPVHGTFASIGGDAVCSIWDALAKKRIRQYPRLPSPLSTAAFSADGSRLAIASGAENIEDTRFQGPGAGEVGEVGKGGEGNVRVHIRPAWEDCKPKVKQPAA